MTDNQKLKTLFFINLFLSLLAIGLVIKTGDYELLIITLCGYLALSVLGNSVGYHRLITHGSFKTSRWMKVFLLLHGSLMCLSPPVIFAIIHRTHHMKADGEGDPHSPHIIGAWRTCTGFGWPKIKYNGRRVVDLLRDRDVMFFENNYYSIIAVYASVLAIYSPTLMLYGYALPATITWFVFNCSATLCHMHGYRNYDTPDKSTNSWIVSILLVAEGWHNNHHRNPKAWSNWDKWWEVDVPTIIIWLIKHRDTKHEDKSSSP